MCVNLKMRTPHWTHEEGSKTKSMQLRGSGQSFERPRVREDLKVVDPIERRSSNPARVANRTSP